MEDDIPLMDPIVWGAPENYAPAFPTSADQNHPFTLKSVWAGSETERFQVLELADGTELAKFHNRENQSTNAAWLAYLGVWLPLRKRAERV